MKHQLDILLDDLMMLANLRVVVLGESDVALATALLKLDRYAALDAEQKAAQALADIGTAIRDLEPDDSLIARVDLRLADEDELAQLGVSKPLNLGDREEALARHFRSQRGDPRSFDQATVRRQRRLVFAKIAFTLANPPASRPVASSVWTMEAERNGSAVLEHSFALTPSADGQTPVYVCEEPARDALWLGPRSNVQWHGGKLRLRQRTSPRTLVVVAPQDDARIAWGIPRQYLRKSRSLAFSITPLMACEHLRIESRLPNAQLSCSVQVATPAAAEALEERFDGDADFVQAFALVHLPVQQEVVRHVLRSYTRQWVDIEPAHPGTPINVLVRPKRDSD